MQFLKGIKRRNYKKKIKIKYKKRKSLKYMIKCHAREQLKRNIS